MAMMGSDALSATLLVHPDLISDYHKKMAEEARHADNERRHQEMLALTAEGAKPDGPNHRGKGGGKGSG